MIVEASNENSSQGNDSVIHQEHPDSGHKSELTKLENSNKDGMP